MNIPHNYQHPREILIALGILDLLRLRANDIKEENPFCKTVQELEIEYSQEHQMIERIRRKLLGRTF